MVNLKVYAHRTQDAASIWFFEPTGLIVTMFVGGSILLWGGLPWWVSLVILAVGSFWTTRIKQTRADPDKATCTTFWIAIPVRSRDGAISTLRSEHSDDFTANSNDRHDELATDGWSVLCHNAEEAAAWIRSSAQELGTPTAIVNDAP